jgi:rhodanese-related sulfurtransferase
MISFFKKLFTPKDNSSLIKTLQNGAFLVDVRTAGEFAGGHVKNSVNIPLDTISGQLGKFKNKQNIVVFCASGMRSRMAKNILQQHGFANVSNAGTWKNVLQLLK